MARQNLMTVVSEVPHTWASSVMVELATPAGSSMTRCATRRSAGGREGSSDRTRTIVLSGGVPLGGVGVVSPSSMAVAKPPPIGSASTGSCPTGFLMKVSYLQRKYRVNGDKADRLRLLPYLVYGHGVLTHLADPLVVGIDAGGCLGARLDGSNHRRRKSPTEGKGG